MVITHSISTQEAKPKDHKFEVILATKQGDREGRQRGKGREERKEGRK